MLKQTCVSTLVLVKSKTGKGKHREVDWVHPNAPCMRKACCGHYVKGKIYERKYAYMCKSCSVLFILFYFRREFIVPEPAVAGLRNALISCERSPKQLQHEADQLTDILTQRR